MAEAKLQESAARVRSFAVTNLKDQVLPWLKISQIEAEDSSLSPAHEEAHQLLSEAVERVERALGLLADA